MGFPYIGDPDLLKYTQWEYRKTSNISRTLVGN